MCLKPRAPVNFSPLFSAKKNPEQRLYGYNMRQQHLIHGIRFALRDLPRQEKGRQSGYEHLNNPVGLERRFLFLAVTVQMSPSKKPSSPA